MEKIIFATTFSFLFTFFGTKYLRKYLEDKKIFDIPIKRSSHAKPTPKGGGWVIVLTIIGIILFLNPYDFMIRIFSWNVNGIRAAIKKGLLEWIEKESPDIICLQETKAFPEQIDEEFLPPKGYNATWNSAQRKGYSGVVTFSKKTPASVTLGMGLSEFVGALLVGRDFLN